MELLRRLMARLLAKVDAVADVVGGAGATVARRTFGTKER